MASAELMIWTIIEPGMCLIAACLLRFKPLLRKLIKGTFLERLPSQNSRAYYFYSSDQADLKLSSLRSQSYSETNTGLHAYERIDEPSQGEGVWNSGQNGDFTNEGMMDGEVPQKNGRSPVPRAYFSRPGWKTILETIENKL